MMYEITCIYGSESLVALADEDEVMRVANEIRHNNVKKRVIQAINSHFPDAKELYASRFDTVIDTITKRADEYLQKELMAVEDLTEEAVEDMFIDRYSPFAEVKADFYSDIEKAWCIDAWWTMDDNEEGVVVARVHDDGNIEFSEPIYEEYLCVLRKINEIAN